MSTALTCAFYTTIILSAITFLTIASFYIAYNIGVI